MQKCFFHGCKRKKVGLKMVVENFSFKLNCRSNKRHMVGENSAQLSAVVDQPNRPLYRLSQGKVQA